MGPVGAGKSSLIQAVLGEMEKLEGHVQIKVNPFMKLAIPIAECFFYLVALHLAMLICWVLKKHDQWWILDVRKGVVLVSMREKFCWAMPILLDYAHF